MLKEVGGRVPGFFPGGFFGSSLTYCEDKKRAGDVVPRPSPRGDEGNGTETYGGAWRTSFCRWGVEYQRTTMKSLILAQDER